MILIDDTVISDDIADQFFVCDIAKCKGACCIEGDLGAPLELDELPIMDEIYDKVKPYLSQSGIEAIEAQGKYIKDWEDDYSTPVIEGKECAYAIYDNKGNLKCGIEQAYFDKKISFRKPISCHLYPIRITKYDQYQALNYDRWHICSDACSHGASLGVEIYKFLKEPLIRKFGEQWYQQLDTEIQETKNKSAQ
ncbi:MAG: DUF3109 family protein [Pseudarcicella sp.]|nr:DUF3109 family protein [Pseudarcicella sp.]MBP6410156.1 DUF3109 family protein [Pseudarcicella sp.]